MCKKINQFYDSSVTFMCLLDVSFPEEDLKKAETCHGISVGLLHVKVYLYKPR